MRSVARLTTSDSANAVCVHTARAEKSRTATSWTCVRARSTERPLAAFKFVVLAALVTTATAHSTGRCRCGARRSERKDIF